MAEFWRTKTFQVLSRDWNHKLEESGFSDIEIDLKQDRALKRRAASCYEKASPLEREVKLEYFCFVSSLVNETFFPNELEKIIMTRHADGDTIEEIVQRIRSDGISRDRKTVRRIIRRWQMKWGVRHWSLKEMHLKRSIK